MKSKLCVSPFDSTHKKPPTSVTRRYLTIQKKKLREPSLRVSQFDGTHTKTPSQSAIACRGCKQTLKLIKQTN